MGTMLVSSGRGEGAVAGVVRFVESDEAVRRVTTSVVVWAEAVMVDMRLISKKAPQKVEYKRSLGIIKRFHASTKTGFRN